MALSRKDFEKAVLAATLPDKRRMDIDVLAGAMRSMPKCRLDREELRAVRAGIAAIVPLFAGLTPIERNEVRKGIRDDALYSLLEDAAAHPKRSRRWARKDFRKHYSGLLKVHRAALKRVMAQRSAAAAKAPAGSARTARMFREPQRRLVRA